VHDDPRAACGLGQSPGVVERHIDGDDAVGQVGLGTAGLREHAPAGSGKGLDGGAAEAALRAEDQNGPVRGVRSMR